MWKPACEQMIERGRILITKYFFFVLETSQALRCLIKQLETLLGYGY